jgi:hypothetical protein
MQKLTECLFIAAVLIVLGAAVYSGYQKHFVGLSERTAERIVK